MTAPPPKIRPIIPNKRRQFPLEMKLKILQAVDTGKRKKDIANEFGISQSTLSTVLKNRTKIEENSREIYLGPYRKRMRGATFRDLDKAVFVWFKEVRSRNIPVNGRRLQEKAKIIAKLLGHENFRASGGWLSRFRERYGISTRMFDEIPVPADDSIDYENFVEVDVHVLVGDEPIENEHLVNNSIENSSNEKHNIVQLKNASDGRLSDNLVEIEENQDTSPIKQKTVNEDCNNSRSSYESDIDYETPEQITFSQAISAFQIVKKFLSNSEKTSKERKLNNSLKVVEENLIKLNTYIQ